LISIRAGLVFLTATLAVAVFVPTAVAGDAGKSSANSVATHHVQRAPGKVADYWTPRRMRRAKPLGIVVDRSGKIRRSSAEGGSSTKQPRSHIAYTSSEVTNPEAAGNRTNGIVFFHDPTDGTDYQCSGTAIDAQNRSLVLTAAHCVFYGEFVTNWIFEPGYHDGSTPFGTWTAKQLTVPRGWATSFDCPAIPDDCPNFDFDVGTAVTFTKGSGQGVQDAVGARAIAFNQPRNQTYHAYGYPAVPNPFTLRLFDGEKQWRCDSPYGGDDVPDERGGPAPMRIGCDMTSGSSGGSWVVGNTVQGLNSYGLLAQPEHMYGPHFGTTAKCVYIESSGQVAPAVDTELVKHPKHKKRKRRAKFAFEVAGGPNAECVQFGFECRLDHRHWEDCSSGQITYRKLARHRHVFRVRALDTHGNVDGTPARFKFKVKKRKRG
jgi:V8-like Glu-specific endopeptidase